MRTIWKFPLDLTPGDHAAVLMPRGARIIHADWRGGPTIWAEVDEGAPADLRRFMLVGTGWSGFLEEGWRHLATLPNEAFVWHLYETSVAHGEGPKVDA